MRTEEAFVAKIMQTNHNRIKHNQTNIQLTNLNPILFCFKPSRAIRVLSLPLACGLSCQMAFAQGTAVPPASSPLQDMVGFLAVAAFGCLLVGLVKPMAFAKLFKAKTSRGRVGWTFGGALFGLMLLNGALAPKAPQHSEVAVDQSVANSARSKATGNANSNAATERVRLAEERAETAEARAAKAENAVKAKANAPAKPKSAASKTGDTPHDAAPTSQPQLAEELSPNVSVQTIQGVGKREVGRVDDVDYAIEKIEKAGSIGNQFSSTKADGVFHVVRVMAYNNDKETHDINTSMIKLLDDQGREFDPSSKGSTALVMSGDQSAELFMAQIQPGTSKGFSLVYDAPVNATGLKLKIPGGFLSKTGDAVIKAP